MFIQSFHLQVCLHSVHPPYSAGGGGVEPPTKFSKRGLDRTSTFRGGLLGQRGVTFFRGGCNFHQKNKLKSEIFYDKKVYKQ